MQNIIEITPNCFILRSQAGFRKLCKFLGCRLNRGTDDNNKFWYDYDIQQITNDESAFEYEEHDKYDDKGRRMFSEDSEPLKEKFKVDKQYPIKYPCIISIQDETFETCRYYFYIKYVTDNLRIKDFVEPSGFKTINCGKKNKFDD